MKRTLYLFLGLFFGWIVPSNAQKHSFTFSDTYPTNDVDSLENWLKTHPKPTEERLKNLIRLKRTYFFEYPERKDRDTLEIRQLSQRLNHPIGKAINAFWRGKNFNEQYQVFKTFETLQDTSGMIYTLSGLASSNYTINALDKGDKYAAQDFLKKAQQLLKARFDAHDYFILERALLMHQLGTDENNLKEQLVSIRKALALSESKPEYEYMRITLKSFIGSVHGYQGDFATSYATFKELLTQLKPDQTEVNLLLSQNLAMDCEELGHYDERLALCNKIAVLLRNYSKKNTPYFFLSLYEMFKVEMDRRGRYKEASAYGDSIATMKDIVYEKQRKEKLIELQAQNKQIQIAELTIQQTQTENRNRLITFFLLAALATAVALGYLGWKLRQSNVRLNALVLLRDEFIRIIAHDLRRPLHAFYGLSEVFSKLLQRGDEQSIIKLSQSIDQSGVYIRQMLDNLLYWALSQKEKLVFSPTTFALKPQLEALISVYGAVAGIKGVQLEYDCPTDLMVHTDVNALDLILRNLIDNATQHTPAQGLIRLVAATSDDPKQVSIQISDTGKGMTELQLQAVREVLATPHKFQPKRNNLGLGLIIVGTFAQQTGIGISVESQEGKGTTITLKVKKDMEARS
jgi:signal transduction histidine kinase